MEFETWPLTRPDFFTMSESFLHENNALTTALITSLSDGSSTSGSPLQSPPASIPEPAPAPAPLFRINPVPTGRISKRKSRASKKSPTTFINTDPANFKMMVQHITGADAEFGSDASRAFGNVGFILPEPARTEYGYLPTLDTSSGPLGRPAMISSSDVGVSTFGFSFPTLESSGAM